MKTFPILIVCFILSLGMHAQIIIPFENAIPVPSACGDTWEEAGLNHFATNIPSVASCGIDYNSITSSSLWLFPALVRIDLTTLVDITRIEVDVTGHCGTPCANFRIYDSFSAPIFNASETSTPGLETLIFQNSGIPNLSFLEIDGFEGEFHEIRIFVEDTCEAKTDIIVEKGDVYVEDSCFGVILTSPNGTCFRVKVNNSGILTSTPIPCP